MQNIRYIIVDDEQLVHDRLIEILNNYPFLTCVGGFYDAISAQMFLLEDIPELIFLDVDMGSISGLDLLKSVLKEVNVVIITAHRNYAPESFDMRVIDFVLKPIKIDRLNMAIQKVVEKLKKESDMENLKAKLKFLNSSTNDYIFAHNKNGQAEKVFFTEIVLVSKDDNYIKLTISDGRVLHILDNIKTFQEILPSDEFIRVNRGVIIRRNCIVKRLKNVLELTNNETITISPDYMKSIVEIIKDANDI